jgi:hypothetical protein
LEQFTEAISSLVVAAAAYIKSQAYIPLTMSRWVYGLVLFNNLS